MSTYAIVGTGAVGGYYGACLQKAGTEVHFLLRSDFEYVRKHGLEIKSPKGDFALPRVNAYAKPEDMPRCEVVVVAWKTTQNQALAATLPHLVKPGGTVLVLQNGLDPERESAPWAGDAKILAGLCFLCCAKAGPGRIRHQDFGTVTLAAHGDGAQGEIPAMARVAEDFRAAGLETRANADWRSARWRKLVWNIPFNGLCALTGMDTRMLIKDPIRRERVRALMSEVIDGAAACGILLPETFIDRMLADTDAMFPYEPSMKLDADAGRPMELDAIYARPIAAIQRAGGRAPEMEKLWRELQLREQAGLALATDA